jgi:hypothetical protein
VTPVYDQHVNQVAWFDGEHVFDLTLTWVAFHRNGHLFASSSLAWLGPLHSGAFLDQNGKPVAWLAGSAPSGNLKPHAPLRPTRPLQPRKPMQPRTTLRPGAPRTPAGGWSELGWQRWVGLEILEAPKDEAGPDRFPEP